MAIRDVAEEGSWIGRGQIERASRKIDSISVCQGWVTIVHRNNGNVRRRCRKRDDFNLNVLEGGEIECVTGSVSDARDVKVIVLVAGAILNPENARPIRRPPIGLDRSHRIARHNSLDGRPYWPHEHILVAVPRLHV